MVRAIDMGDYFRIPSDNRDLNYDQFFSSGDSKVSLSVDYTSHHAKILDYPDLVKLILSLEYVRTRL